MPGDGRAAERWPWLRTGWLAMALLLLGQLGPVLLWDDQPLDPVRITLGVAASLLLVAHLVLLVARGIHRSSA